MKLSIPAPWSELLNCEASKPYFTQLEDFLSVEYSAKEIFPPQGDIFRSLELCPPSQVKVVIVGQDPYHDNGQAHGLSFSVPEGVKFPPSLRNILKEVSEDVGVATPQSGSLERWAEQGVLLLNAVLTVEAHAAASHAGKGWETFTDAVIKALAERYSGVVYMLWGSYAHKKGAIVNSKQNLILKSVHPSPLSAYRGFFGSKHFSQANDYLVSVQKSPIEW
ncbi:MAG: uracil-DNA glycosylase [Rikenellaceae bacterium]